MISFITLFYSATKASLVASVIFIIEKKTDLLSVPSALVYFGIVIFFVYFKLSSMLLGIHDPFLPFENLFCALFMGNIWDALAHVIVNGWFCRTLLFLFYCFTFVYQPCSLFCLTAKKSDDNPKVEIPRRDESKKKD